MTPQVIDRLVRRPAAEPQDPPLTTNRAVGVSVARAAQQALGLSISVAEMAEEEGDLDALTNGLTNDLLILSTVRKGGGAGVMACNPDLVAAALEALTTGRIATSPQPARAVTNTDAVLIRPLFTQILDDMAKTCGGSALDGWSADCSVGARYDTVRAVEFALKDCCFRMLRIKISDGTDVRKPELIVALPQDDIPAAIPPAEADNNWAHRLAERVNSAPVALNAVLGQIKMSLAQLTALEVGDSVPLAVKGLDGISLMASDGSIVARGSLGQLDGRIAVRVEIEDHQPARDMEDFPRPAPSRITTVEQELCDQTEIPFLAQEA